jgi:hypothetical protein
MKRLSDPPEARIAPLGWSAIEVTGPAWSPSCAISSPSSKTLIVPADVPTIALDPHHAVAVIGVPAFKTSTTFCCRREYTPATPSAPPKSTRSLDSLTERELLPGYRGSVEVVTSKEVMSSPVAQPSGMGRLRRVLNSLYNVSAEVPWLHGRRTLPVWHRPCPPALVEELGHQPASRRHCQPCLHRSLSHSTAPLSHRPAHV